MLLTLTAVSSRASSASSAEALAPVSIKWELLASRRASYEDESRNIEYSPESEWHSSSWQLNKTEPRKHMPTADVA